MCTVTTPCACTARSASLRLRICWRGGRPRSTRRGIASWNNRASDGRTIGNRRHDPETTTMTLPGETEAGTAGMQPRRGIPWWAHRDDVGEREGSPFELL